MKLLDITEMKRPGADAATFQGSEHGANVSFFVVEMETGKGPKRHRHAYEETFIVLDGEILATVDGATQAIGRGKIAVIPPNTWHEFTVISETPARMINVHPVPTIVTEWAD
jgi:quercetin dioxygenase-like cupin family protein